MEHGAGDRCRFGGGLLRNSGLPPIVNVLAGPRLDGLLVWRLLNSRPATEEGNAAEVGATGPWVEPPPVGCHATGESASSAPAAGSCVRGDCRNSRGPLLQGAGAAFGVEVKDRSYPFVLATTQKRPNGER